ncbi:cuticle protein CP14.6-like [Pararge aegeria]|uniref:Jg9500 protein n=1 Tax=Pararge aegeria aegeria TaxID=348720 RepID=A0A8S4RLK1_9NEOP|nr:cuticle protein CP14.6-like [Pararge aegeria]CAH2237008.1 jg9500 [Pararge aegeria aegeria]
MKTFFILSLCVAASLSASIQEDNKSATAALRELPALEHEEVHDEFGQYALRYVTAEGTVVSERGRLVPSKDGTGSVLITDGEVSYVGDDGKTYVTKYTAGLDGYKAEGSHLPQSPEPEPVPSQSVLISSNQAQ